MTGSGLRALATAGLVAMAIAGKADAGTSDAQKIAAIVRRPILTADLGGSRAVAQVRGATITFGPLQKSGRHKHPVPVVGYVLRGQIRFEIAGQPARILSAGQAFFEPADTTIERFENVSSSKGASFVAFYLMGSGDTQVILPDPAR